jgi:transcriptional regulator with XRE-family HTH domain
LISAEEEGGKRGRGLSFPRDGRFLNREPQVLSRRDNWIFLRQDSGTTLDDLAAVLDVNKSTISRSERGERDPQGRAGERYQTWLIEQRALLIEGYRNGIFRLAAGRDEWPYMPTGDEQEAIWREFWRAGGWADQWRRTGVLPNTNRLETTRT